MNLVDRRVVMRDKPRVRQSCIMPEHDDRPAWTKSEWRVFEEVV